MGKTSKFELSLAKSYVSDWGIIEGVRELFQNALDQEIVDSTNTMFYEYDEDEETLRIGNLKSHLETKSLLLGMSSKQSDKNTIGQFGEGYKVGTLALIREGKEVVFHNYGKREVWKPRFVKSRRFAGEDILTFFVEEKSIWNPTPHNDLVIEIKGITSDEYEELKEYNLHMKRPTNIIPTQYGNILDDVEYQGKIYVNGLFVEEVNGFSRGYDLKAKEIKLDRDRRSVEGWSLQNVTKNMWISIANEDNKQTILNMAKSGVKDVAHIEYESTKPNLVKNNIYEDAYELFANEHGDKAVPVTHWTYNEVKQNYPEAELVTVTASLDNLIQKSTTFKSKTHKLRVEKVPISTLLQEWIDELELDLCEEMQERLDDIIEKIEELE